MYTEMAIHISIFSKPMFIYLFIYFNVHYMSAQTELDMASFFGRKQKIDKFPFLPHHRKVYLQTS
jgi:hypothetical protein